MVDPHHLAGDWQSCDLDWQLRPEAAAGPCVMSPDLEGGSSVGWVQQEVQIGITSSTGLNLVRSEEKGPWGRRWGWGQRHCCELSVPGAGWHWGTMHLPKSLPRGL